MFIIVMVIHRHYSENMKKFTAVLEALNGERKHIFLNKTMTKLLFE